VNRRTERGLGRLCYTEYKGRYEPVETNEKGTLMREGHPMERAVGMAYYASEGQGTGGQLRAAPKDFRVRELERFDTQALDADPDAYPHLVCRVTLRGWDTNDFARELSNRVGISRERVDWAGTKDKRAVSTQLLSIEGRELDSGDLPAIDDAGIEAVGRSGRGLNFGDLAGNAFEVVVSDPERPGNAAAITAELRALGAGGSASDARDATTAAADAAGAVDAVNATDKPVPIGVPNYFGQQRFGSRRPVTHTVGLAICRWDWEGAVMAYVGNPRESEPERTRAARRFVEETQDWSGATHEFPGGLRYERAICGRLAERERERNQEAEDERENQHEKGRDTREHGGTGERGSEKTDGNELDPADFRAALDVLPRNLQQLFVSAAQSYLFNRVLSERLERGLLFDRAVPGDVVCFADRESPEGLSLPDVDRGQRVDERRVETVNRHCARARAFVTAPLIGTGTDFAGGEPGGIEREVLHEEGLSREDFDLPEPYGSGGTRRAVLCCTDVEVTSDPLRIAFRLPKGSYATTLLREYLKSKPTALG
jgi:tRNA pseudouridine13 synthase